ncbi:hypothetical protein [Sphingopyxis sp. KK2]|uniref:hypothetical protein n=1 Tax=Sphingopyxis sp. KK2 TaxID=1855727 RepID=UPI00097E74CA|nr:hypothetical protein [Sphingopyxis sp. KK2]
MTKRMIVALSALMGLAATPALAQGFNKSVSTAHGAPASSTDFLNCDGYGPPKGKSDGIARETFLFGAAARSADIRRNDIAIFGERGLAACDRALADAQLIDAFWLRRANLLQAKAVHAIGANQPELALKLTAESDAIGRAQRDPYFAQSIGLGNQGVRAYALIVLGRKDEALAAIEGLTKSRPLAQSTRALGMQLQLYLDPGFVTHADALKSAIPLSPERGRPLFWMHFLNGNYDEARVVAPTISFDLPKQRGGWTLRGADSSAMEQIGLRASVAGAWAYAESVAGNHARARALLDEAGAEIDEIMTPPPPREDGRPPKRQDVDDHARRLPFARKAKAELALWNAAIAFRPRIATMPIAESEAEIAAKRLQSLPIAPDILSLMRFDTPEQRKKNEEILASIRSRLDVQRTDALKLSTDALMAALPRPETAKVVPTLKPAGDGYFLSDSGLSRNREGKTDIWTIRYTHKVAPIAAVEELAMLGAAQTAQREGFDSMLLLSRISISRTTNVSSIYVRDYQLNSGYEAQMRVRFVNAAALPADVADAGWRLVPAKQVIDELSDRYKTGGLTIAW